MQKNLKILTAIILAAFIFGISFYVFGISAILRGEIVDNGGDPNLEVWFQWGKTTSYGYETQHQYITCYSPPCQFSDTISNLDPCTTYHYRAAAKHRNFEDTRYGQDQSFTTPCDVKVDLKANNSDGPISVPFSQRQITLSWTSQYADSCTASGDWSGTKSTSGSEQITLTNVRTYTFTLVCKNNTTQNSASDSVQVTLLSPNPPQVVTKGVVITL